jgi:hypothetical protein
MVTVDVGKVRIQVNFSSSKTASIVVHTAQYIILCYPNVSPQGNDLK